MDNPAPDIDQVYDTFLKALFRTEIETFISYFFKGATLDGTLEEAEQNVEIDRSMLRIDLSYWIRYLLLRSILHIELQSCADAAMARRLLAYFACLHLKHNVPIFCIVIFLFKCAVPQPPYSVSCGEKTMLREFDYIRICLWEEDPQPIIDQHLVPLFVLLPAMKNPTLAMLRYAISEIREYYDFEQGNEHLAQFHVILSRTTTVPDDIKDIIGKEILMNAQYTEFMKQNPYIQQVIDSCREELLAQGEAIGRIEGKIEGKIEGAIEYAHKMILKLLRINCPDLLLKIAELPQRLGRIQNVNILEKIEDATIIADKQSVQKLIEDNAPAE